MRFEEALKAMTDLTEQWKKGELPEGWYYTKIDLYENGDYFEIIPNKYNDGFEYGIVKQVLAPVPNYNDWKKAYDFVVSENEEITTLKELLKECRGEISTYRDFISGKKTFKNLLDKISQALGEDK